MPVRGRDGATRRLFVHAAGTGVHATLLHGFPSSSWDFAPLVERLEGVEHLAVDLLGFGASDKPASHTYSLFEQLGFVEQLWDRFDVEATWVVAHDYSVSLAQEILARQREDAWPGPAIEGVVMLNGGLFYSAIDRKPVQDALRVPVLGPLVARLMPRWLFERSFSDVFADAHQPTKTELGQHWQAITARGGRRAMHGVAAYLTERRANESRWTRAVADPPVPVRYVWGLEDPVSGPTILHALRERVTSPDVVELEDVGHYPHIEAPDRVHAALPGPLGPGTEAG